MLPIFCFKQLVVFILRIKCLEKLILYYKKFLIANYKDNFMKKALIKSFDEQIAIVLY